MSMYHRLTGLAVLGFALAQPAAPASAACRLALVLAIDISSSVDGEEDRLQREGLAAALISQNVTDAILSQPGWDVALHVFEWSGREQQNTVLDWTVLSSRADIARAASVIAVSERRNNDMPTALGYALGHAAVAFERAPDCERQVVDVSGDGKNNAGFGPEAAYKTFPLQGVTVNGLAIGGALEDLPGYFERSLINGPGAFVEIAQDYQDFEKAMTRKLVRETGTPEIGLLVE